MRDSPQEGMKQHYKWYLFVSIKIGGKKVDRKITRLLRFCKRNVINKAVM